MPTLLASRLKKHFPARHFPARHFHAYHFVVAEFIYSDAPHECIAGEWDLTVALNGTFSLVVSINGIWPEC